MREELGPALRSPGARAGFGVLAASMVGHLGNYLYYVLAARALTPAQFAQVTAMTALATTAFMPASGVQAASARDVAMLLARGEPAQLRAMVTATARQLARIQAVLLVVLLVGTPAAVAVLDLDSWVVWFVGVTWLVLGVALQAALGPLQGFDRFLVLSAIQAGPQGALRPLLLLPLVAVAGVVGALAALVVATVAGLVMVTLVLRRRLEELPADGRAPASRSLIAVVALLAFASLTNADVVAAKIGLGGAEAGVYSSAALLGKIALYGPSALSLVLLPKVTSRLERGLEVAMPVLLTKAAAVGTGALVVLSLVLAPASVVTMVFGPGYEGAYRLAVPLAAVMTVCALLNVQLIVGLAARSTVSVAVLAGAALLHVLLLAILSSSAFGIVLATGVAAGAAVLAHEALSPHSIRRLLSALRRQGPAANSPALE